MYDDLIVQRRAWHEMRRAFAWYHARNPQAALRFLREFWHALEQIAEHRDRWPRYDPEHRFFLLSRFPYYVLYRTDLDATRVVAVCHAKRRPGYWKRRKAE
jgi:plasmid stabilization system protein ParE